MIGWESFSAQHQNSSQSSAEKSSIKASMEWERGLLAEMQISQQLCSLIQLFAHAFVQKWWFHIHTAINDQFNFHDSHHRNSLQLNESARELNKFRDLFAFVNGTLTIKPYYKIFVNGPSNTRNADCMSLPLDGTNMSACKSLTFNMRGRFGGSVTWAFNSNANFLRCSSILQLFLSSSPDSSQKNNSCTFLRFFYQSWPPARHEIEQQCFTTKSSWNAGDVFKSSRIIAISTLLVSSLLSWNVIDWSGA